MELAQRSALGFTASLPMQGRCFRSCDLFECPAGIMPDCKGGLILSRASSCCSLHLLMPAWHFQLTCKAPIAWTNKKAFAGHSVPLRCSIRYLFSRRNSRGTARQPPCRSRNCGCLCEGRAATCGCIRSQLRSGPHARVKALHCCLRS